MIGSIRKLGFAIVSDQINDEEVEGRGSNSVSLV